MKSLCQLHWQRTVTGLTHIFRRQQHIEDEWGINRTHNEPNGIEWLKPSGQCSSINVYNTATRRKVPLVLNKSQYVTWYTCGPTVYDSMHLGHASCYVKLDIIQRILRKYFKYNLVTAMNITDIDDKIIHKSQAAGRDWCELARAYETEFWTDLQKLNILPPNHKLRVTDFIPKIIDYIKRLIDAEQAYITADKSVYFDVAKFEYYGKLMPLNLSEPERAELLTDKQSAADFALWKARKTKDEPSWPAPWGGMGRPGWHIECSTLASMIFGKVLDFHVGGHDLRFPHHENEEAQCCAYHKSKQWVNYWLHAGQLHIKGDTVKMSKSLGNTISVNDMLTEYTADEFRMACLLSNYRSSMNYSPEMMETARQILNKFKSFNSDCQAYKEGKKPWLLLDAAALTAQLKYAAEDLDDCLSDDFDTARAISGLIDLISNVSRCVNTSNAAAIAAQLHNATDGSSCLDLIAAIQNFVLNMLHCFGLTTVADTGVTALDMQTAAAATASSAHVDFQQLIEDMLTLRASIRSRATSDKNRQLYAICDELRLLLSQHGIEIRDHPKGSSWQLLDKRKRQL